MVRHSCGVHGRSRPVAQVLERRIVLSAYHVTNTNDTGAGSLRQAILDSNASAGADVIDFSIGHGSVQITPQSALPVFIGPVTINGTTQSGFVDNPIVVINGADAGPDSVDGLKFLGGKSLMKGLVVNGFSGSGIVVGEQGADVMENNFVGTDVTGKIAVPNLIHGIVLASANNTVGGPNPSQRNLISGNGSGEPGSGAGVFVASFGSVIQGNFIGTDVTGTQSLRNITGIAAFGDAAHTTIGGSMPGEGNLISGNTYAGALIGADFAIIAGNVIGYDVNKSFPLGNSEGVVVAGSSHNLIGGTTPQSGNLIAWNKAGVHLSGGIENLVQNNIITHNFDRGVNIDSGTGQTVTQNSIYDNSGIGIDLLADFVTSNTPGGPHTGPNYLQNFPVLQTAVTDGYLTTITGTLNSTPLATFILDFYDSPTAGYSGFGEGKDYIGSKTVTTDSAGNATFTAMVTAGTATPGDHISATATSSDGSTSEFSFAPIIDAAPAPLGTPVGFQYQTFPHEVSFRFNQQLLIDSIEKDDLMVRKLPAGTDAPLAVSFRYDQASQTLTFALPPSLVDGNYRATLPAGAVVNYSVTGLAANVSLDFFEFRGDANHDRTIDFNDLVAVAQNYNAPGIKTWAAGDFNGDQKVDFYDLVLVAQKYGATLPAPSGATNVFASQAAAPALDFVRSSSQIPAPETKKLFSTTPIKKPAAMKSKGRKLGLE